MTRFVGTVATLTVLGLATYLGGCSLEQCTDDVYYAEDVTGQVATADGGVDLTYQGNEDGDGFLFAPASGDEFPSLSLDAPPTSGSYSLADLHAQVCTATLQCAGADGVLMYKLRPDLAVYEFDAEIGFVVPSSGSAPPVTGWLQVSATREDSRICRKPGGGFGVIPTGIE